MNCHRMETSIPFDCLSCTLFLYRSVCGTRTLKFPDFYIQQKLLIDHRPTLNSIPQQSVSDLISKQCVCHVCHRTLFMILEVIHRYPVSMTCFCFGFPWCILRLQERTIHHPSCSILHPAYCTTQWEPVGRFAKLSKVMYFHLEPIWLPNATADYCLIMKIANIYSALTLCHVLR